MDQCVIQIPVCAFKLHGFLGICIEICVVFVRKFRLLVLEVCEFILSFLFSM